MKFADKEIAEKIVRDLYPSAHNIIFIEHGYDNLVVLVDKQYAVRFPKYDGAYARSQYEKQVLLALSSFNEVAIPKILGEGLNPPYLITSFLHGQHLSSADINKLSTDQQKGIGEQIARFAYTMHSQIPAEKVKKIRNTLKLNELEEEAPWKVYFEKVLYKGKLLVKEQDELAKKYFEIWKRLTFDTPTMVIHDDLHTENILFEDGELIGVLDFGDTNIGKPEQEFRQLYRIGEVVLNTAVYMYELLSGYKLNREAIKIWAIVQELAAYSEKLQKNKTGHPAFSRAVSNLSKWLPQVKWG